MSGPLVTASALDRVAACPASAVLPASRRSNAYSTQGTMLHRYWQRCSEVGRDAALDEIASDADRELCAATDTDALPIGAEYVAEVAFAYNVKTGTARELGRGKGRDYSTVTADEIPGTVDVVAVIGDVGRTSDYKSGYVSIPQARTCRQLKLYALCVSRVHGVDRVIGDIIRARPDEEPYYDSAEFDAFDLDLFAAELRDIYRSIESAREQMDAGRPLAVVEGDHCRYCPAQYRCPSKMAMVRQLADSTPIVSTDDLVGELDADTAGEAYRRVKAIDAVVAMVKSRIYELARSRPIPIGSGQFLGEVTKSGNERIDAEGAFAAAREQYGDDIAELVAPPVRKATKKEIKKAMRVLKERGVVKSIAAGERLLLDQLRASGHATRPLVTKVEAYDAPACTTSGCREVAIAEGATCSMCALDAEFSEIT